MEHGDAESAMPSSAACVASFMLLRATLSSAAWSSSRPFASSLVRLGGTLQPPAGEASRRCMAGSPGTLPSLIDSPAVAGVRSHHRQMLLGWPIHGSAFWHELFTMTSLLQNFAHQGATPRPAHVDSPVNLSPSALFTFPQRPLDLHRLQIVLEHG
jgi:hypothetical protein